MKTPIKESVKEQCRDIKIIELVEAEDEQDEPVD
jgi:hypothetical protein